MQKDKPEILPEKEDKVRIDPKFSRKNIVKDAKERFITLKQERLCQLVAQGNPITKASKRAGYAHHSHAFETLTKPYIQSRIQELIEENDYKSRVCRVWSEILDRQIESGKEGDFVRLNDLKLRTIDQIARLGAWEPNKVEEIRKVSLNGNISEVLPGRKDS